MTFVEAVRLHVEAKDREPVRQVTLLPKLVPFGSTTREDGE